jgi:hypothetical protein
VEEGAVLVLGVYLAVLVVAVRAIQHHPVAQELQGKATQEEIALQAGVLGCHLAVAAVAELVRQVVQVQWAILVLVVLEPQAALVDQQLHMLAGVAVVDIHHME